MLRLNLRTLAFKQEKNIFPFRLMSSSSSSSDEEISPKKKVKEKQTTKDNPALNKLNILLKQMIEEDTAIKTTTTIELARPKRSEFKSRKDKLETEIKKDEPVEKKLVAAAQEVAETIGGDTKKTESELLQRLLGSVDQQKQENITNLSEVIKGMKIDRKSKASEIPRALQIKQLLRTVRTDEPKQMKEKLALKKRASKPIVPLEFPRVDLFGSEPLGIFNSVGQSEGTKNETWDKLNKRELRLAITQPPANYFQQMILWTEQGKIWKFPINNEQDWDEDKVPFTEHIFLEKHLEPWCPPKGPIRHFMELVCVGLSKNPYVTVETKKEHIEWYRNYFSDKEKLLREVGAIPPQFNINQDSTNKLEA